MGNTKQLSFLAFNLLSTTLLTFTSHLAIIAQSTAPKALEIHADEESYQKGCYEILDDLYILADPKGEWTINDISSHDFIDRFKSEQSWNLFGNQPDMAYYWCRFTVRSHLDSNEEWLLNLTLPEITLFSPTVEGKEYIRQYSGTYVALSNRHLQGKYGSLPYLSINLAAKEEQTFYLRIKPGALPLGHPAWRHQLNGILASPAYITQFEIKNRTYLNFFYGIFLAVALYHLIFFVYNRQLAFLYFGLSVLFNFVLSMYFSGHTLELFLTENPVFNNDFMFYISNGCFIGFLLLFASHYLNLKHLLPGWNKVLLGMVGLLIVYNSGMVLFRLINAPSFYENEILSVQIYTLYVILIYLFILLAAIRCVRKRYRPALIFLIAIGITVSQNLVNVLTGIGLVPFPQFMTGDKGSALGLLLFAIGLGQQFKRMQLDKFKAEAGQKKEREESQRLRELNTFKNRFYTNITHEFRTPLTVIQGLADQIEKNPKWKIEEQTKMIKKNSGKLLNLINQMLDLSKLEAGKLELHFIQSDIIKYLGYLVESFHSLAFTRKINISFYSHTKSLFMDYDPEKCQQIISNLISNAIKFTPEYGKITVTTKALFGPNGPNWLELIVEDTGIGIAPEKLHQIFDRFYQIDDSNIRRGEGSGLGLAMVKELTKLMEGKVEVESELGKGTRFIIMLPIHLKATKQDPAVINKGYEPVIDVFPPSVPNAPVINRLHDLPLVLIVEDNADVIYYLRKCLEGQYLLEEARNGQEGIEKAIQTIPDLVISDVMMPEVDGFELCENLKADERTNHIPIILLTAKVTREDKLEGLTRKADAYLTKPFQEEELLVRMQNLIELRRQLQLRYQKADGQFMEPGDTFMKNVWNIIRTNLDDSEYSVVQLSRDLGMSRAQVYRKLKALTGLSASHYIRLVRMKKAIELLQHTDLTIAEIGYEVGFKTPSHFTRVFTQHFGKSPSELRK